MSKDAAVGSRIREIRTERGWALRELGERCGLSANAISLMERGENSPTVSSLRRLAEALKVPITAFFEERHDQTCVYVKRGEGMRIQNADVELESLGFGLPHQQLEPFRMTMDPHAKTASGTIQHPGQEFVYCLSGQVDYVVGGERYQLKTGDSLLFNASTPHAWENSTDRPASILLIFQVFEDPHLARQSHLAINS